ncbi:agmatine coumaroyltransferase-2-like [Musa acuminata AAA Group]|uniref:agmatine coumaroyltransferase-2-like n=1 Tax=Musa acuminata AAA Group TaxID=214697 RepID=UPI0031E05B18
MPEQIEALKVRVENSKHVKPLYKGEPPRADLCIPFSVFDKITCNNYMAVIYAFEPPSPSNSDIEKGLATALTEYRDWAGRLREDARGDPVILLNDSGPRFVEASSDAVLDRTVLLGSSPALLPLSPCIKGAEELLLVQLTRFACGTLVLGFTTQHLIADGHAVSKFLVAWGLATRGLPMDPRPLHDRGAFIPRNPPCVEFEHRGVEFKPKKASDTEDLPLTVDIVIHKTHFTREFLESLKAKASLGADRSYSSFESLMAHLWRVVTKARGLDEHITSHVRISVDGRARLRPRVPGEYFGNLVLWAFPRAKVGDLVNKPLQFAAALVREGITRLDDGYFRSFIDFASSETVKEEGLEATAEVHERVMSPNLEVHSWLKFPFRDVDFGGGNPFMFMPTYTREEGMLFLMPSAIGDGSIEVYVSSLRHNVAPFKQLCYLLD